MTTKKRILQLSPEQQTQFISLVEEILALKSADPEADTNPQEAEIDGLVYKLYDLTYDEVLIVEPECSMSRENYEAML